MVITIFLYISSNFNLTSFSLVCDAVLVAESYDIKYKIVDDVDWIAENVIEPAGLVLLANAKKQSWQVDDDKIDDFVQKPCT